MASLIYDCIFTRRKEEKEKKYKCSVCNGEILYSNIRPHQSVCYVCYGTYPQLKQHYIGQSPQFIHPVALIKYKITKF